jgi:hypothetical protein
MVHFDLKLLNCLYAPPPSPPPSFLSASASREEQRMSIGFEDHLFAIPIASVTDSCCGILKLIDFGTSLIADKASSSDRSLGRPIDSQQVPLHPLLPSSPL